MPIFTNKITESEFFRDYWRKKPCFLPTACNINELIACSDKASLLLLTNNELIETRLVSSPTYEMHLGPFQLNAIPKNSLLMIQGLDQHLSELNQLLLDEFSFLPRWRIEDVMATIGDIGANCGAHFDNYDVFLLQVSGAKTWQLDDGGHNEHHLDLEADIRLLQQFEPSTTHHALPGDVLYIPPGFGHWGIAKEESITLSVGIRNPTIPELISHLADSVIDSSNETALLDDDVLSSNNAIAASDISNLEDKLSETLLDPERLADWYGCYMTELREPDTIRQNEEISDNKLRSILTEGSSVSCMLPTRITYVLDEQSLTVYVNGDALTSNVSVMPWLQVLCTQRRVDTANILQDKDSIELLQTLWANGSIEFDQN